MHYGRRAAGTLLLLAIGVSGLVTFPGGGAALREDGLETMILTPPPDARRAVAAETVDEPGHEAPVPAFLLIPSIGVSAVIEQAGLTPERQMENPTTWDNVAWYRYGPSPGQEGSAVLAGHLDSETSEAVFWDLNKLKPGDTINIIDARGDLRTFSVTAGRSYRANDVPMEELFAQTGEPRIALVTCDGAWSGDGGYDERYVVFAALVE